MKTAVQCVVLKAPSRSCGFFFSSRRRHTRWNCDWSSDVCSSDLPISRQEADRTSRMPRRRPGSVSRVGGRPFTSLSSDRYFHASFSLEWPVSQVQPFTQVNAFTDRPFAGNPAAVCLLPSAREAEWMQLVAREMNLAETAFLVREGGDFQLRWFTPTIEVDLCGHATLASAHALWESGNLAPDEAGRFQTRSGLLTAERRDGLIWLDFPSTPPTPADAPPELRDALGIPLRYVGRTPFDYLVEVDGEAAVRALTPDLAMLGRLPVRGVIVT